jgi:hypothetical protein
VIKLSYEFFLQVKNIPPTTKMNNGKQGQENSIYSIINQVSITAAKMIAVSVLV